MKGGQECGGRNEETMKEFPLCFVASPNTKKRVNKEGWSINGAGKEGIKTHTQVTVLPIAKSVTEEMEY